MSGRGRGMTFKSKLRSDGSVSLSPIILRLLIWRREFSSTIITSSFSPENNADRKLNVIIIIINPRINEIIP